MLLILLIFYCRYERKRHGLIMLGQMMGSALLIVVSALLAFAFHLVLAQWLLGFLGLVPIFFGAKLLLFGDDDADEVNETLAKRKDKSLFWTACLLSFATCGADNIGLFTPYLVTLATGEIGLVLLTFAVNIVLLSVLSDRLSHLPHLGKLIGRYSRWIEGLVYLALGAFIFIETGSLSKILSVI